jgi:hypothetical protein
MKLKPPYEQKAPAIEVAACQFGGGHDWTEITTVHSFQHEFVCDRCGALADNDDEATP